MGRAAGTGGRMPLLAGKVEGTPQAGSGTNGIPTTRLCAMDPTSPRMNLPGSMDVTRKETHWPGVPEHLSPERQE